MNMLCNFSMLAIPLEQTKMGARFSCCRLLAFEYVVTLHFSICGWMLHRIYLTLTKSIHVGGSFLFPILICSSVALSKANGVGITYCVVCKRIAASIDIARRAFALYSCYYSWDKLSEIWINSMINVHPDFHQVTTVLDCGY